MKSSIIKQLTTFLIISRIQQGECQFSTAPTFGICLESIFDSLYDRGYQPHYIQEDITDNEKADGEYLEFPDFNSSQESLGTLNHPSWLNYQKEVFFPPESEYKNIIYPKNEKTNEKIASLHGEPSKLIEDKWNSFLPPIISPQELKQEIKANLAENTKTNLSKNSNNLDFLIPIPESVSIMSTEVSRILSGSEMQLNMQKNLQLLNFSIPIGNQETNSNNFTPIIKPLSHSPSVNLQPTVKSQSIFDQTQELLHLKNCNINLSTPPQKMYEPLNSNLEEHNNSTNNSSYLPTKNITVYEVEVSENTANISQYIDQKQTKKKKFSILSLFHKKNDKGNASIISKTSEKGVKNKNITISQKVKKEKPNNLKELYSQLVNEK